MRNNDVTTVSTWQANVTSERTGIGFALFGFKKAIRLLSAYTRYVLGIFSHEDL